MSLLFILLLTGCRTSSNFTASTASQEVTPFNQTPDGGFLIVGDRNGDGLLMKTDTKGNLLWSQTLGGEQEDGFIPSYRGPME
jgi:outer membrane protein assembly factor BamB